MKILNVQALRGKNFWSYEIPNLIQLRLDTMFSGIEEAQWTRLKEKAGQLEPPIGFDSSNENNLLSLGMLCAILAQNLQKAAGLKSNYCVCKATRHPNVINIVVEYQTEYAGKQAVRQSVGLIQQMLNDEKLLWDEAIQKVKAEYESEKLSPALEQVTRLANEKNIPIILPDDELPLQLGYGINGKDVFETFNFESESLPKSIPIFAITGSNGKTTTTRLIAHILREAGKISGFTTSDGIYVGHELIEKGDTTGPMSAHQILRNKKVEVAVLETARGGLVRAGLGFENCDIGVITNVQEDHLGISDIETMEDLSRVKSIVYHAVKPGGYAVLNADNNYCEQMAVNRRCNVCWFSLDEKNTLIQKSLIEKEKAIYVKEKSIYWFNGTQSEKLVDLKDVPVCFGGHVSFMIQNAMAAAAACILFGISVNQVCHALQSFFPGAEQTPGRLNIFNFKKCRLLVDFAHNPDGFGGIRDFLKNIPDKPKIGIITGTGDRRDEIMHELGKISAQMFDHIIIHQAKFLRGKTRELLISQLVGGILEENVRASWEEIPDGIEPLGYALEKAPQGSMIIALSDVLNEPIALVEKYQKIF